MVQGTRRDRPADQPPDPVIAYNLTNYAAGLAGISWWTFLWTTGRGIVPSTALFTIMG